MKINGETMAGSLDTVERNLLTCLDNGCLKCGWDLRSVPSSCEFGILHALTTDLFPFCPLGEREMKRRSGKTTSLLRIGNAVIASGRAAILVTPTYGMKEYIQGNLSVNASVNKMKITTLDEVERGANFGFRGFVLADEIYGENLEMVKARMSPNPLLAAYYTLPEHG